MLNRDIIKKIEDFVSNKPRSIQEISIHINKNWRTADRYIKEIEEQYGTLSTRTFRKGTRGALKIVYWSGMEKISSSVFQEQLERQIMYARKKEDFSAFDIYQHVPDKSKKATLEKTSEEDETNLKEFKNLQKSAKRQLLIFSGNLSFINLRRINMLKIFEELIKKEVKIKIICRVDLAGKENVEKVLSLNFKYGKEAIEIRHKNHPIRGFIVDNKLFRIKEIKEPTGRIKELNKKIYIFYTIKDKEWAEWLSRIFWKMFSESLGANKRLQEMKKIKYSQNLSKH